VVVLEQTAAEMQVAHPYNVSHIVFGFVLQK
jgi:hypothetical protein